MTMLSHLTVEQKRARLATLEDAQMNLAAGIAVAKVSYADGGHDYHAPDPDGLARLIRALKADLGMIPRRRSRGVTFS